MARLALTFGLTAVGAAAGAYFGNPLLGAQIGYTVGSVTGALAFPGGEDQIGPRLGDVQIPKANYGTPIPIVYGAQRVAGMLIWTSGIEEVRTEESTSTSGGPMITTFAYFASFAIGLCEGPLAAVRKIWLDTKLVYDVNETNEGLAHKLLGEVDPRGDLTTEESISKYQEFLENIRQVRRALTIYLGTETQLPDPLMEAVEGAGAVPAYRGLAYLMFEDLALANYGNRHPLVSAEVLTEPSLVYPKKTVTPTGQIGTNLLVYDAPRRVLWSRSNHINSRHIMKVDAFNNKVLLEQDTVAGLATSFYDGMDVDIDGALYMPTTTGAAFRVNLARFDPLTLQLTHYGLSSAGTAVNLPLCSAIKTSEHFVWYSSIYLQQGIYIFLRPGILSPLTGKPQNSMSLFAQREFGPSIFSAPVRQITIDRNETAWGITSAVAYPLSSGTTTLWNITPVGDLDIYDITADLKDGGYITYDTASHSLICGGDIGRPTFTPRIIKWDITTKKTIATIDNVHTSSFAAKSWHRGIVGRRLWLSSNVGIAHFVALDVDTFTIVRDENIGAVGGFETTGGNWGPVYDPETEALWAPESGHLAKYFLDRVAVQKIPLRTIINNISSRVGLSSATDLNTGALSDLVHGYTIARRAPAQSILAPLLQVFFVDAVESDWILKYTPRAGKSPVATLTTQDLAAHAPDQQLPDVITPTMRNPLLLPVRIDVTYADPALDYQENTQHARIHQAASTTRSESQMTTPVVLTANQAKTFVEQALAEAWVSQHEYQVFLPYQWETLDPGDLIVLNDGVRQYMMLITSIHSGANGVLDVRGTRYDRDSYGASSFSGAVSEAQDTTQTLVPDALTILFLMDLPLLRDVDDTTNAGFYLAAGPDGTGDWPGATVAVAPDAQNWGPLTALTEQATWGAALTVLPTGSSYVFDHRSTVDIRLARATMAFASVTEDQVLNGANAFRLGDEVVQFATAIQLTPTDWRLSNLLRGRRGTEWAIGLHGTSERFVLLQGGPVRRVNQGISDLDLLRWYKPVTIGSPFETAPEIPFINTGRGLKPYSPDYVTGTRDGSNNLTIAWLRRTRVGGAWRSQVGIALGETSEAYEVDILSGSTVVRTIIGLSSPTATYTAAQQTADGLTPGNPVAVRIYQLSSLVGRGYAAAATI